ncbi:MAG: DNA gyrase inhibitor YacG [Rhodospirillales bacterium]|mgnify:CR=1 FL=1|jgi:hypothetical protein|nr:DNA gyrase inhibitor YacG [Rhodospirillales bacterium]MDP7101749.1 DNA gyrase inhibitor YacG [Rhodospirillales bacterium]MDP7425806.1 DNA gyrase inhibitor YacG [Rhodospirillales bacterium]MDP7626136.1 DNA gyrase inhibitor YacG [Rhodospirillales bacterium]HJO87788.1 DNA gyrase inhibitor YacG [Rhodospirillales bacterium]|tara:strand:- start:208 stop:417 length:210 start_codon:yes stop_codon:yes gene_type:complete
MATSKPTKNNGKRECPNCGQPTMPKFRPFCSARCSQLDLSNWLNEDYRVPVVEIDDFDEDDFPDEEFEN